MSPFLVKVRRAALRNSLIATVRLTLHRGHPRWPINNLTSLNRVTSLMALVHAVKAS